MDIIKKPPKKLVLEITLEELEIKNIPEEKIFLDNLLKEHYHIIPTIRNMLNGVIGKIKG